MVDKYYGRRDEEMSDRLLYSNTKNNHPAAASFSSTLLDEIYRSMDNIDQGGGGDENMNIINGMRKKQSSTSGEEEIFINFQRPCMMERKKKKKNNNNNNNKKKVGGCWDDYQKRRILFGADSGGATTKNDGIFINTKSRPPALNLKQPISPGARLAGFFNSLFTKTRSNHNNNNNNNNNNSPSSSSSSSSSNFSARSSSCLSKTTTTTTPNSSSRGIKPDHKRSVEQDFQIKNININPRLVAARDFLRNYQKKDFHQHLDQPQFDDQDDDDAASYASSDLFELDNLSAIGMERYREELPVYETTHLHTNRAIASGFIL